MTKLPNLEAFGISRTRGFLSDDRPLASFNNTYYAKWDALLARLPHLLSSHELANEIHGLPVLEIAMLSSEPDFRRAYVVLGFLIQGLVWGETRQGKAVENIPPQLSEPFLAVCQHLGMAPVLSYAGASLWNWTAAKHCPAGTDITFHDLLQLRSLGSFTESFDERAFCLVPVLVEAEGGPLIQLLLRAVTACDRGNASFVIDALNRTADILVHMRDHLSKLFSMMDADRFYHEIRPFFRGSKNMERDGLPNGILFHNRDGSQLSVRCVGASAGQSALFQFLDIVLGIKHENTVYCQEAQFQVFITRRLHYSWFFSHIEQEMRACMPRGHREFLLLASELGNIRSFVELNMSNQVLVFAYNNCVEKVRSWRGRHIAVASKYIVQPGRLHSVEQGRSKRQGGEEPAIDDTRAVAAESPRGTGGTFVVPFLRQLRDETVGVKKRH